MKMCRVTKKTMSDGWTIKEIDYHNYEGHHHYYYLGKRAPVVKVGEEKFVKQYAGYTLIEKDLRSILVWLNEIENINPGPFARYENPLQMDLVKGYFVAALTFYGKCFTASKGRGLKYDRVNVPEEHRETHDTIMEMRHNFTAHSGIGFESVKVSLVLHPDIYSDMEPQLYTELRQPDLSKNLIKEMIIIVKKLQEQTLKKRTAVGDKFLTEIVRPQGKLFWYQRGTYDEFYIPEIPSDDY
ncbi:hypothetical protein EWJ41_19770 [Salmonella enterica subsp. enterica serovar Muenchen]|nr:hypothetical protein [Salmonella enterica]EBW7483373.1 hypothetical protein [Salmonella enterica subsp. enterica serovar Muenchen]EBX5007241.1 hypothetical protein [Salmonella enterica subsp. enterica serovar Sarajane]ECA5369952.1 hypothetical protein [Salmonella enterica subsp. enterica serovar Give]KMV99863.1 hypothetical protein HMPREF9693_02028 [Klebsiella oxytoca 10-5249]MIP21285.1 hypothetical protein [Salmonella enterica subsp. enterica serovar Chandans]SWV65181.1 Uncharacterised pr